MESEQALVRVERIVDACAGLSSQDALHVLELTWMSFAAIARNERSGTPDGFPTEQARQLQRVREIADDVRSDAPDPELERLSQGGKPEDFARLVRRRLGEEHAGKRE